MDIKSSEGNLDGIGFGPDSYREEIKEPLRVSNIKGPIVIGPN